MSSGVEEGSNHGAYPRSMARHTVYYALATLFTTSHCQLRRYRALSHPRLVTVWNGDHTLLGDCLCHRSGIENRTNLESG